MRYESNLSSAKMKMEKSNDDSSVEEIEKKLNNFSLDAPKSEKNNIEINDLSGCKTEEAEEPIKVKKEVVKNESDEEVDEAADALNDLSIEPKTEDDERIPRGPTRRQGNRNTIMPYVNRFSQDQNLPTRTVVEGIVFGQAQFGARENTNDYYGNEPRHLAAGGTVEYSAPFDDYPEEDKIREVADDMYHNPKAYLSLVEKLLGSLTEPDLLVLTEGFDDLNSSEGQPSISGSPPQSNTYLGSPGVVSVSSGYESGTSSPSHSPPRSDESFIVPEPIQKINERRTAPREILPKLDIHMPIQTEFHDYILNYGNNVRENLNMKSLTHRIYWSGSLHNFTHAIPDGDGDTMLMILLANPKSTQEIAKKYRFNAVQETVFRLFSIFHLVERFHKDCPGALEAQNKLQQSVLHLAASNCNEHPMVAAYIAEKLELGNYNFTNTCCATNCFMRGTGNLLHCIAYNGDSHAEVLNCLLKVEKLRRLVDSPCRHSGFLMLTPMFVAIKTQNYDPTGTFRCLKTVDYLINNGASITTKSFSSPRQTALHIALQGKPNYNLVALILGKMDSTEVNVPDAEDNHPLMIFAKSCSQLNDQEISSIIKLLLARSVTPKKMAAARKQELFNELAKHIKDTIIQFDVIDELKK